MLQLLSWHFLYKIRNMHERRGQEKWIVIEILHQSTQRRIPQPWEILALSYKDRVVHWWTVMGLELHKLPMQTSIHFKMGWMELLQLRAEVVHLWEVPFRKENLNSQILMSDLDLQKLKNRAHLISKWIQSWKLLLQMLIKIWRRMKRMYILAEKEKKLERLNKS